MNTKPERKIRVVGSQGDTRAMLRVAIATGGDGVVDGSFGRATVFAIYEVATEASQLIELVQFAPLPHNCSAANDNPDECQHRIDARIAAIDGCHLIFARRIGDIAAASAIKSGIHPIAVSRDEPIPALLGRCQTMLATNPPPWLRRGIGSGFQTSERPERTESLETVPNGTISATGGLLR